MAEDAQEEPLPSADDEALGKDQVHPCVCRCCSTIGTKAVQTPCLQSPRLGTSQNDTSLCCLTTIVIVLVVHSCLLTAAAIITDGKDALSDRC